MEYVDLIDRILPNPLNTIVVETSDEILLVDTSRKPRTGDRVLLDDDRVCTYNSSLNLVGVVYCSILLFN